MNLIDIGFCKTNYSKIDKIEKTFLPSYEFSFWLMITFENGSINQWAHECRFYTAVAVFLGNLNLKDDNETHKCVKCC